MTKFAQIRLLEVIPIGYSCIAIMIYNLTGPGTTLPWPGLHLSPGEDEASSSSNNGAAGREREREREKHFTSVFQARVG